MQTNRCCTGSACSINNTRLQISGTLYDPPPSTGLIDNIINERGSVSSRCIHSYIIICVYVYMSIGVVGGGLEERLI